MVRVYRACLIVLVAALLLTRTSFASGDTVVRISYAEVHDRVLPSPRITSTTVALEIHLIANGTVEQHETRASGPGHSNNNLSLRLGRPREQAWHVAGPNRLINTRDYYTYTRAIEVTVSGNSCTARVGYSLKPGQRDYQYPRLNGGARATARSVSAGTVTCSIR